MGGHRADSGADPVDGPVDLAAVHADDAMLDAVHGRHAGAVPERADEDLVELLAAWRADIDARPMPELVSLDEAVAAVESGRGSASWRPGRSVLRRVPLVAAAAMALALLGFGTAVHSAMPGQPLWGVSKVVFNERAASVESAAEAQTALEQADAAIANQELSRAKLLLDGADTRIDAVRPEDRGALEAERRRVSASLAPGAPLPPLAGPDATSAAADTSSAPTSTPPTPTTATATSEAPPPSSADGTPDTDGTPTTTTSTPPPRPGR